MSLNQQFEGGAGGSYVKLNTEDDADKAPIVVPAVVVEPTIIANIAQDLHPVESFADHKARGAV